MNSADKILNYAWYYGSIVSSTTTHQSDTSLMSPAWKIEGDYFEGCNCDVICPCIFMADPDEGFCDVIPAWHIKNGNFGNIDLDDLNVVAFFHAPGNMLTGPKWKVAMYIDQRATAEQSDAITKIFSGQAGGFFGAAKNLFGEILGIKQSTIEFGVAGRHRWLRINDSLELDIEGIKGADQDREALITNPAFSAVPGSDLVVARSTKNSYKDFGFEWNNSGKNGFYCKFKYSSS
jgi:hypothetical protein